MPKAEFVAQKRIKGSLCILFHQAHGTGKAVAGVSGMEVSVLHSSPFLALQGGGKIIMLQKPELDPSSLSWLIQCSAELEKRTSDEQRSDAQGTGTKARVNH